MKRPRRPKRDVMRLAVYALLAAAGSVFAGVAAHQTGNHTDALRFVLACFGLASLSVLMLAMTVVTYIGDNRKVTT